MRFPLTLQTKVGRRVLALFVLSALVPILAMAALGYAQVRRQLVEQTEALLAQSAKSAGMGILDQLRAAQVDLGSGRASPEIFDSIVVAPDPGGPTLMVSRGPEARVWLAVSLEGGRRRMGAIRSAWLFEGASERAIIGNAETGLCIQDHQGVPLFCPERGDTTHLLRASWEMFLSYGYGAPPWRVETSQPREAAFAGVVVFRRVFLATALAILGLVVLLATIQVRRTLRPLQQLQEGTRRVAQRDFRHPVAVNSGDEFEDLAGSFNTMTNELGQLVQRLEQLSYGALAALARAVDASSHWTAGHSERVTALALRMAERFGLDNAQRDTLRRGGLLHDIGKIGISPDILDKPGVLDPEELAHIRRHPEMGARILAPLEAFADAIPIVLYHHERYDGTGYPKGLAGESIPLLARLLAVADVYDALVSSRPYRRGWDPPVAFETIRNSSGTHFDPRMVELFFEVMETEGDAARLSFMLEPVT